MNNQFEFKSYIPTPNDQYGMLGLAKVKLYGKIVITFKHVKTKDGNSSFFCTNNYTLTDAMGEKKYLPCVLLDSRDDDQELQDFIRDNVNKTISLQNSIKQTPQSTGNYYPNGFAQQAPIPQVPPTSMSEVAAEEQIPF